MHVFILSFRKTRSSPSTPYTEVDNLIIDLYGKENLGLNLINVGDTEDLNRDDHDPARLLLEQVPQVLGEAKGDRLQFTRVEMEDEELLVQDSDHEENDLEKYFQNDSQTPLASSTQASHLPISQAKKVVLIPSTLAAAAAATATKAAATKSVGNKRLDAPGGWKRMSDIVRQFEKDTRETQLKKC